MKRNICILVILVLLVSCKRKKTIPENKTAISTSKTDTIETQKKISFKRVSEIVQDESYSTWVSIKAQDSSASLALHFQHQDYKDTLAVSYSPECWLMFPYKIENEKIIVYWDKNIDTKYNFEIVKAINKTSDEYIGKPFMILELANDTTFKATYPIEELIEKINRSSKVRTFFTPEYKIAQNGFL